MEYMWFWAQRNSSPKTEDKEPMWTIPFWVSQHCWYKPFSLVSESIFLWSKCQVGSRSDYSSDCNTLSKFNWKCFIFLHQIAPMYPPYTLTLSLPSNRTTFLPKHTHSVVESRLMKIKVQMLELFWLLIYFPFCFPFKMYSTLTGSNVKSEGWSSLGNDRALELNSVSSDSQACDESVKPTHQCNTCVTSTALWLYFRRCFAHMHTHTYTPEQTLEHICIHAHFSTRKLICGDVCLAAKLAGNFLKKYLRHADDLGC